MLLKNQRSSACRKPSTSRAFSGIRYAGTTVSTETASGFSVTWKAAGGQSSLISSRPVTFFKAASGHICTRRISGGTHGQSYIDVFFLISNTVEDDARVCLFERRDRLHGLVPLQSGLFRRLGLRSGCRKQSRSRASQRENFSSRYHAFSSRVCFFLGFYFWTRG